MGRKPGSRRPPCDTLYDVFRNVRRAFGDVGGLPLTRPCAQIAEDEGEHVKTMKACMDYSTLGKIVVSPHAEFDSTVTMKEKRELWKKWSQEINSPQDMG